MSIEYPTGISTKLFSGRVTSIGLEEYKIAVFPTSSGDKVKLSVFVVIVPVFAILGSTSNLKSTEFQSIASPARAGYPPVAPLTALVIDVVTNAWVARFAVFAMPWTSVVSELCAVIAAFLFVISAASASIRFCRYFAIEGFGRSAGFVFAPS